MTGAELKAHLFKERGDTSINRFAVHLGMKNNQVESYFRATRTVNQDVLRKYAEWQGYDVYNFLSWANGPEKPMPENIRHKETSSTSMVEEQFSNYNVNLKNNPGMLTVILEMIAMQREQNAALMKLANAAEYNALVIAKLNGIDLDAKKNVG